MNRSEGLFGVNVRIQAHPGDAGEQGVRIEQSEHDGVVALVASLDEGTRVVHDRVHPWVVVGTLRVEGHTQGLDARVDFDGVDLADPRP